MTFPLLYTIGVNGEDKLKRVFRGIESEAKASASRVERSVSRTTRAGSPDREARQRASAAAALDRQRSTALFRQHQQEQRLAARAEADRLRSVKRVEAARTKEAARGFAEIGRAARAADAAHIRARQASVRSMARGAAAGVGRGVRNAIGVAGTALAVGGGVLGGMAATGALDEEIRIRAAASRLANQAKTPELKGQLAAESKTVKGFTGTEVLGGIEEFVTKTGDLQTARTVIGSLGTVALATGTDLGDLGATAGQAFNVLRDQISDPAEQVRELNSLIGVLGEQGAMGAVEIRDLARDFGKLGAATRGFEGGAPTLLRAMGAFAQVAVARGGAEGSADASTAAARMANDIVVNKKKFKALGVNIKSKTDPTKLRDPMEIIGDVLEKTGGDVEKTAGLFGLESAKIFKGFAPVFAEAEKKKKGTGRAAIMAEFNRYAGATPAPGDMERRAASRLGDEDMQMKEAMKAFNSEVGTRLIPVLTTLIPKFEAAIPGLADLAGAAANAATWLTQNPFQGMGVIVGGFIVKELAAAAIGSAVTKALERLLGGGAGGGGTAVIGSAADAAGGVGKVAKAARVVAAGAAGFSLGAAVGADEGETLNEGLVSGSQTQLDLARGGMSEEQMISRRVMLQSQLAKAQEGPGAVATVLGGVSSLFGGASASESNQESIAALKEAIAQLTAALNQGGNTLVAKLESANIGKADPRTSPIIAR